MNFDKSKVYTTVNAEDLKVGSKVLVGYNLLELKESLVGHSLPKIIKGIEPSESLPYRFLCDDEFHYPLVYLIEEPKENVLKWNDLKLGDVITDGKTIAMVTVIEKQCSDYLHIFAGNKWLSDCVLAKCEKVKE